MRRWGGSFVLVMKNEGYKLLKHLRGDAILSTFDFLQLSLRLGHALGTLHCKRYAHLNICPTSVLVHPATLQVKVRSFT